MSTQGSSMNEHAVGYSTDEVFGINRDVPLNYVARSSADISLVENLTRDKHLVIYGSSKQGKTCLRKHCLKDSDYIVIQCQNRWTLDSLHSNILKRAGFEVTLSDKKTESGKNKVKATLAAKVFGIGSEVAGETERDHEREVTRSELELDPFDANDVIAALKSIGFDRYIVLEDFHYLSVETQMEFAIALKAFHELSKFCFIIIGVWLEENRLIVYNGDLTGRVVSINADRWEDRELEEVILSGANLLNVEFVPEFVSQLIQGAKNSVYIVQEACRKVCIDSGVSRTSAQRVRLGGSVNVAEVVKNVVNQQSGRYKSFITQFSAGFQETELKMYQWLLYPILLADSDKLEAGFTQKELRDALRAKHPEGTALNPGNLTQALQSVASLQVKKNILPIILDYDSTNLRLRVVDRGFILWLSYQDRKDLLDEADLPTD